MSRSYRSVIFAVAGLAIVTLSLGVGAYFGALNAPYYGYQTEKAAYRRADTEQGNPSQIDRDRAGLPYFAERVASGTDPADGTEREKRDLAAQESMSVWTFWMLVASAISVVTTMIGTGFLLWQIILTRQAVEDTGLATDAMRESNAIAENAQRPWIKMTAQLIDVELIERRAIVLGWQITFTNVGGMVAENFQPVVKFAAMGSDFLERMNEIMNSFPGSLEEIDSVLIPNDENWWRGSAGQAIEYLPWENRLGFRKDCRLVLVAMVRYRIPGQTKWRFSMQGFVIAENISHIDDVTFRYDFPDDLSLDNMHIRKLGRSRAT